MIFWENIYTPVRYYVYCSYNEEYCYEPEHQQQDQDLPKVEENTHPWDKKTFTHVQGVS